MQIGRRECVICSTPIAAWRAPTAVLCESLSCAFRFAAIPAHEKCLICTRPVPPLLRLERHCGSTRCRQTLLVERPSAGRMLVREALLAGAPAYRAQQAQASGLSEAEGQSFAFALLPHNRDQVKRLPKRRRRAFEKHLRTQLAAARRALLEGASPSGPSVDEPPKEPLTPRGRAELAILGAGCGTCRGNCCRGGGNHAYHGEDSMARYLKRFPQHDDDAVIADYLHYVPSSTMSEGCIYQRDDGCGLPRDMRANICNVFYCEGLQAIRYAHQDGGPVRAFFAHHDGHTLYGGTFMDIHASDA